MDPLWNTSYHVINEVSHHPEHYQTGSEHHIDLRDKFDNSVNVLAVFMQATHAFLDEGKGFHQGGWILEVEDVVGCKYYGYRV